MRTYFIEKKYTITEEFRINAEFEEDARRMAKSGDFEPLSSVKGPDRITCSWPLAKRQCSDCDGLPGSCHMNCGPIKP